jgi:hypothetical protein
VGRERFHETIETGVSDCDDTRFGVVEVGSMNAGHVDDRRAASSTQRVGEMMITGRAERRRAMQRYGPFGARPSISSGAMAEQKLTPLQETEAKRLAAAEAKANRVSKAYTDEEKTQRKERVEKAKDALSRSVGIKGEHVAGARTALKKYLRQLNEPNQPDDARFELLIEAPFKAPPKKRENGRF